ncbi:MAG: YdcF family protein [Clostridia bacterium]|nr:YdcF family protein [Clostridia bacterium]
MSKIQIILSVLGAGVAFINYTVYLCISRRNALPIAPVALACIVLPVLFCIFFGKTAAAHFPRVYEALKWIYISIGLIYSLSFIAFSSYLMAPVNEVDKADVFIVFGCKTYGYSPSYALEKRLEKAYELLSKNPDSVAVLSGGQGDDETVSEAGSMRKYLTDKGIPEDRLIIEDRSTSTITNIKNSMELIRQNGYDGKKISAVSNDFHVKRILKQAEQLGYDFSVSPARMPIGFRLLQNLTREYMVWVRNMFTGTWEVK